MINLILFIHVLFKVYSVMLFIRILASWIPEANEYRIIRFIAFYTNPYLNIFRKIIPPLGMFDLSPIIAFLGLSFLENIIIDLLGRFV